MKKIIAMCVLSVSTAFALFSDPVHGPLGEGDFSVDNNESCKYSFDITYLQFNREALEINLSCKNTKGIRTIINKTVINLEEADCSKGKMIAKIASASSIISIVGTVKKDEDDKGLHVALSFWNEKGKKLHALYKKSN